MFVTLDLRSARWWLAGMVAGLLGWAIWEVVQPLRLGGPELAVERQFAPAPTLSGPEQSAASPELSRPAIAPSGSAPSSSSPVPADGPGSPPATGPDALQAERERLRSREMELAERILEDPSASDARKAQAQLELVQLLQRSRREVEVEQLLAAAGMEGAVVHIGEAGVQVVVPQTLSVQAATRIGELVARMVGVRREQISIIDSMTALGERTPWQESPAAR